MFAEFTAPASEENALSVPATAVALAHLGLGEPAAALDWLERAYEERDFGLGAISVGPVFEPLYDEPRFQGLLERMGLPDPRGRGR